MNQRYNIFGKSVNISCEIPAISKSLIPELYNYPISEAESDVEIQIVKSLPKFEKVISNPKVHWTFPNGFGYQFDKVKVLFIRDKVLKVYVLPNLGSPFRRQLNKLRRIDFASSIERFGMVFHELVLVPMAFLFDNYALIHASAFKSKAGIVSLIGGTGGVGKTSLEVYFCQKQGFSFLADDISVVGQGGKIFPNLSYPKIYGYNLVKNKELNREIFKNRGFLDKLQWFAMKYAFGPAHVRRRIDPSKVYSIENQAQNINNYYIISRTSETGIKKQAISILDSAAMTLDIILAEYSQILRHIHWHNYNCQIAGFTPIITPEGLISNMKKSIEVALTKVNCFLVEVPNEYEHLEFLAEMKYIIQH